MWLVIAASSDHSALWAARGLARRGLAPLRVLTPEAMVYAVDTAHGVGADGAWFTLALHDGRRIDSRDVRGALNRFPGLPSARFDRVAQSDRDYAREEWDALVLSWLAALPEPVVNAAGAQGASGEERPPMEWAWLAGQAGLATRARREASGEAPPAEPRPPDADTTVVLVLDEVVFGAVDEATAAACVRLRQLAGERLIGVGLTGVAGGSPVFAGATPRPDLRFGGTPFLDALARALAGTSTPAGLP